MADRYDRFPALRFERSEDAILRIVLDGPNLSTRSTPGEARPEFRGPAA